MQELRLGHFTASRIGRTSGVPKRAPGIYSGWEGDRRYVGMSGRAMAGEELKVSDGGRVVATGLRTRMNSHARGRRSGDQFCIYVSDRFVAPALTRSRQEQVASRKLSLDILTQVFVREPSPIASS